MARAPQRKTQPSRSRSGTRSGGGISVTFLVIVLFILVVTVFVLAFREPLSKMNSGTTTASPSPTAPTPAPAASARPSASNGPGGTLIVDGGSTPAASASPVPSAAPSASPQPSASPVASASPSASPSPSPSPAASQKPGVKPSPSPAASARPSPSPRPAASASPSGELKSVVLYFARVKDDGSISVEQVKRTVNYSESPLVSSIKALLKGPDGQELSRGLMSMIPAGTSLLSARVQDGVAWLNFSEGFMFNPLGVDGLKAQVRQVVYVATEFSTVKAVQILIEGKTVQYLGGDNVAVGKPLTRASLP